jgi:epoxyqueuosine reductase
VSAKSASKLTESIRSEATKHGFDLVGICPAIEPAGFSRFEQWLASGYHGEMSYLPDRKQAYRHPNAVMDGVVSIVMLGLNYKSQPKQKLPTGYGRVAQYAASGIDYHDVVHERLKLIRRSLLQNFEDLNVRGVVDTAPLLEREFAQLCGLGWFGKNTMLISKHHGSYFFLACLLLDQPLIYDQPHQASHCGTCTACLTACPTDAFPEPGVLDARRCISYLTIEHKGSIPRPLRKGIGGWVFGCDICQEICPWNRKPADTEDPDLQPNIDLNPLELDQLFRMSETEFRRRFRKTPMWRTKRRGLLRNAAIVLGNRANPDSIPALVVGLADTESIVREASAWALGQIGTTQAIQLLHQRLAIETDRLVIEEIDLAISAAASI